MALVLNFETTNYWAKDPEVLASGLLFTMP